MKIKSNCSVLPSPVLSRLRPAAGEANWRNAAGNAAGAGHRRNGYGRNLVYL